MSQTPDEIIAQYRAALGAVESEEVARRTKIAYRQGWYAIFKAYRAEQGTWYIFPPPLRLRGRQVLEQIARMRTIAELRANAKKDAP